MMFLIISAIIILLLCILFSSFFSSLLPKWFCIKLSWHVSPKEKHFDGESYYGTCPRCGKKIKQYQQGGWF